MSDGGLVRQVVRAAVVQARGDAEEPLVGAAAELRRLVDAGATMVIVRELRAVRPHRLPSLERALWPPSGEPPALAAHVGEAIA